MAYWLNSVETESKKMINYLSFTNQSPMRSFLC